MTKKKGSGGRPPGKWSKIKRDEIKSFREAHSISRARFAGILGVSPTSVQNWEVGKATAIPRIQAKMRQVIDAGPAAFGVAMGSSPASKNGVKKPSGTQSKTPAKTSAKKASSVPKTKSAVVKLAKTQPKTKAKPVARPALPGLESKFVTKFVTDLTMAWIPTQGKLSADAICLAITKFRAALA